MKNIENIKKTLLNHPEVFKSFQVKKLQIFGSFAKGTASEKSDVDVLVEFLPEAQVGFFEFLNFQYALEDILKIKVDLVSKNGLHPALKDQILNEAIDDIEIFVKGLSKEQFLKDKKAQYAVIRAIEIIGEAAFHIPDGVKNENKYIQWRLMKDMRNKLSHEYFGVDLNILWETIHQNIPHLKSELKNFKK